MRRRNGVAVLFLALVLVATALVVDGPRPGADQSVPADAESGSRRHVSAGERASGTGGASPDSEAKRAGDVGPDAPELREVGALRAAIEGGDTAVTRRAAAELRRRVRTDAGAWDSVAAMLGDGAVDVELRAALALVLGTVDRDRTDEVLRRLAGSEEIPEALRRAAVLAVGAAREPEDDDEVFGLGDRPWGEDGPGGLGITIRREIPQADSRAVLAENLRTGSLEMRRVAAVALRHSLDFDDTRAAFEVVLRQETADEPLSEVAESFAVRARSEPAPARDAFLRALVARAGEPGLDGMRFRVIDDLHRVALPADVASRLRELALGSHEFGVRAFGLDLLAAAAASGDELTVRTAREVLVRVLEVDVDAALRDTSARLLRSLPANAGTDTALLRAVLEDSAWNVRYTALETLSELESAQLDAALRSATNDGDERVRALAAALSTGR